MGRALKTQEVEEILVNLKWTRSETERPAPEKIVPWVFAIANKTDTTVDVELSALENEIVSASQIKKSIMNPTSHGIRAKYHVWGLPLGCICLLYLLALPQQPRAYLAVDECIGGSWVIIGNQLVWTTAFP